MTIRSIFISIVTSLLLFGCSSQTKTEKHYERADIKNGATCGGGNQRACPTPRAKRGETCGTVANIKCESSASCRLPKTASLLAGFDAKGTCVENRK